MNKILLLLIIGIFFFNLSLISSQDDCFGIFKKAECVDLPQTCENCSFINLTRISYPNSSAAIAGQFSMTQLGNFYNYTFCETDTIGKYYYTTNGDLDGFNTTGNDCFYITTSGNEITTAKSMTFFISIFVMVFMSILFFIISFTINKESRLRFGLIGMSLIIGLATTLYSAVAISEAFDGFPRIAQSFEYFLWLMLFLTLIIFLFVMIVLTVEALDGMRIKKGLKDPQM